MNDWHDWFRAIIGVLCAISLVILPRRFGRYGYDWNTKTRDYWFSLTMWSMAGVVFAIEGIVKDYDFGIRLVFIAMASAVSLKGLLHKGAWGGVDES